jgi:hypothetical protein
MAQTTEPTNRKIIRLKRKTMTNDDLWSKLIDQNKYLNEKKTSCSDQHSYCTLVDRPLTQSQYITLGTCMERLFNDAIRNHTTGWRDASKDILKKGDKQKDHIWINDALRKIIYAEQKNNINLDTEKSVSTKKKVEEIVKQYEGYEIVSCILAARYLHASEPIAQSIINRKYKDIQVLGVNDYFTLFGVDALLFPDYDAYKNVISRVVDAKFHMDSCSSHSS